MPPPSDSAHLCAASPPPPPWPCSAQPSPALLSAVGSAPRLLLRVTLPPPSQPRRPRESPPPPLRVSPPGVSCPFRSWLTVQWSIAGAAQGLASAPAHPSRPAPPPPPSPLPSQPRRPRESPPPPLRVSPPGVSCPFRSWLTVQWSIAGAAQGLASAPAHPSRPPAPSPSPAPSPLHRAPCAQRAKQQRHQLDG